jgi:predicted DNA-binding transcriptional regulator YafY
VSEYSQIQRLIIILQQLSIGRSLTTEELLQRFERRVSKRTLQRDLITLSEAGIPLLSEKSRGNENLWYLDSRFNNFVPIPLGLNEYLAAHTLKENLKVFNNTVLEKDVKSFMAKIEQILPSSVFLDSRKGIAESFFEQYSAGLFDYSPHNETIETLIESIIEKKICKVTYTKPGSDTAKTYKIEPVKLVNYSGALYTIVFIQKHHAYIILAVQRIQSIQLLDEEQGQNHHFNEDDFWQGKFGLFPGEQTEVVLKFSPATRYHIEGRQWHASQVMETTEDGEIVLTLTVGLSPELISWILGWHENVKVVKPIKLKKRIAEHLGNTLKLYS